MLDSVQCRAIRLVQNCNLLLMLKDCTFWVYQLWYIEGKEVTIIITSNPTWTY